MKSNNLFGKKKRFSLKHWEIISIYLVLYDIFAINLAYFLGLFLRFDLSYSKIPIRYLDSFYKFIPIYTIFAISIFFVCKLYHSIWRFASFDELNHIVLSNIITNIIHIIGISFLFIRMPISYYIAGATAQFIFVTGIRFAYRYVNLFRSISRSSSRESINVMLIGAGAAGQVILKELKLSDEIEAKVMCVIDDNENKWGRYIEGVKIVGGRDSIIESAKKYNIGQILFAIPTASENEKKEILNICKETKVEIKMLPGIYQLANGEVSLGKMKSVDVEDLLGRETIKVNLEEINSYIKDKVVLVTGGGGSIGSELSRQIAKSQPKKLIIFDIYENNAYDIEQELKREYKDLDLLTLIGSVRDSRRLDRIFEEYKPDIVYHAAAHKHVPLMETSPKEAVKNNIIGTYKTAYFAMKHCVERFVLISTDKAVNPTNVMGASKRVCEMIVQSMNTISINRDLDLLNKLNDVMSDAVDKSHLSEKVKDLIMTDKDSFKSATIRTKFVGVRFGNVLGSNGSVIPLFKKQIKAGGPLTVTHKDIIRYFMTISEAVSLVLQAGSYARGGEIFVLDMGEPVKIDTLARNLIKLSGYEPDIDIKIVYTGLRPGEKMYEEKLMEEEGLEKTDNNLIHIGKQIEFDIDEFLLKLRDLAKLTYDTNKSVIDKLKDIVPSFCEK